MKTIKVRVSPNHVEIVEADTEREAKVRAWENIVGGYTYRYKSLNDFIKRAKIKKS